MPGLIDSVINMYAFKRNANTAAKFFSNLYYFIGEFPVSLYVTLCLKLPRRHCIFNMTMKPSMSISFSELLSSKLKGRHLICILIYFCEHLSVTNWVKRLYTVIPICMQL